MAPVASPLATPMYVYMNFELAWLEYVAPYFGCGVSNTQQYSKYISEGLQGAILSGLKTYVVGWPEVGKGCPIIRLYFMLEIFINLKMFSTCMFGARPP